MSKVGRPSKLTDERRERLVEAIKKGATYELACGYAGISYESFRQWMKAGAEAQSGQFLALFAAIKEAEGEAAYGWLDKIENAASEHWQAAAWKLERRYPQDYGRQVQEISGFDYSEADMSILNAYELECIIAGDDARTVFATARARRIREAAKAGGSEG